MDDPISIACPHCGALTEFQPTTTLYPNSDELTDLMQGKLNRVECNQCEQVFPYPTPVVYRDDEHRRMIYYLPYQFCPDAREAANRMNELYEDIFSELGSGDRPDCRLVMQRSQFIEKISLLQNGHDDRVIEYVKYMLYQNADDLDPAKHELLFDFTSQGEDALTFIAFDRETHQADYSMEFFREDYNELVTFFLSSEEAAEKLDELFPDNVVSVDLLTGYGELEEP